VPPLAFFPHGFRTDLNTVPSCSQHNNDNSKDVEYVRNLVTTCAGINEVGLSLFCDKTKRSLERSPALLWQTFRNVRPVVTPIGETGAVRFDMGRFDAVMKAIANALYFKHYDKRHTGHWGIFSSSLLHAHTFSGHTDPWQAFRNLINSATFAPQKASHPWVFKHAIFDRGGVVLRFDFYESFRVFALSNPDMVTGVGTPIHAPACR